MNVTCIFCGCEYDTERFAAVCSLRECKKTFRACVSCANDARLPFVPLTCPVHFLINPSAPKCEGFEELVKYYREHATSVPFPYPGHDMTLGECTELGKIYVPALDLREVVDLLIW